jgi:hypothetical protein
MADKRKAFTGRTAGEARGSASEWLRNFDDHGPLHIKSIRVTAEAGQYVATVTYSEAKIETSPRHFADHPSTQKAG